MLMPTLKVRASGAAFLSTPGAPFVTWLATDSPLVCISGSKPE
jgi:hypothetical protein